MDVQELKSYQFRGSKTSWLLAVDLARVSRRLDPPVISSRCTLAMSPTTVSVIVIHSELHWLDIPERVKYKLGVITHSHADVCTVLFPSI